VSRATLISRIVFAVLLVATFTSFFVAQRLKRTDPLVYSVNVKRYVSPNDDGLREKARLRFRTKKQDVVTVEVIDRSGFPVRTLADKRHLRPGPHSFFWNGRREAGSNGQPVPDGAYRVRITMRNNGRTFIPDKYFVVDTTPPELSANVVGAHTVSVLTDRAAPVNVKFAGIEASKRVEFLVYRVRGQRTLSKPVASFANVAGKSYGTWDQTVGHFRERRDASGRISKCAGRLTFRGKPRPAPVGSYVIVVRACDAAGNQGTSSADLPPRRGSTNGLAGVTLNGVQVAPPTTPSIVGERASFNVNAPVGGYSYRLSAVGGSSVARGRAHGDTLSFRTPDAPNGLYTLRVKALKRVAGDPGVARTPVVVSDSKKKGLLIVYPSIAWQATNPIDVSGDGFGESYPTLPPGKQLRISTERTLSTLAGTRGFAAQEGALAEFLASDPTAPSAESTTDFALAAADPAKALAGHKAVLFAGDERWITPQLGTALRSFVESGGKVAFFAPDAFRRTVSSTENEISGPSERRQRDIFGEAVATSVIAPAPVIAFEDKLGLLRGPTGQFTTFEQSQSRARSAELQTSAGRVAAKPALAAYSLGKGEVIRVGVGGWLAALDDLNVAYTTRAILAELQK
jgi:hypothetical protein